MMNTEKQLWRCRVCGVIEGVRLFRGRRFIEPMCDGCALAVEWIHPTNGLALRVVAVAAEAFAVRASN